MSYETRYAALKRQQADARANTAEAVTERLIHRKCAKKANADMQAAYPVLTAENALEAVAYQNERLHHHKHQARK